MRDDITNELYIPKSSTIVLKRKKNAVCSSAFGKRPKKDALVDPGAYVSAVAQTELDRNKQQAPANIFKIDDPPNFQIHVANGQLAKPLSTAAVKLDIGRNTFAEHIVLMKTLTGPIIGLHFMRHNSVVIDTTHGLIHFPQLTMQAKNAAVETSAKLQLVPIQDNTTAPAVTTKTITVYVDHPSDRLTTGTGTPLGKFAEAASLLISHSISTKKTAVRITNTTESPYLIMKNTQIAKLSEVTSEQSKFIRPVDSNSQYDSGRWSGSDYLSE